MFRLYRYFLVSVSTEDNASVNATIPCFTGFPLRCGFDKQKDSANACLCLLPGSPSHFLTAKGTVNKAKRLWPLRTTTCQNTRIPRRRVCRRWRRTMALREARIAFSLSPLGRYRGLQILLNPIPSPALQSGTFGRYRIRDHSRLAYRCRGWLRSSLSSRYPTRTYPI